ncbi:MAG: hypothetical protein HIU83_17700 [Proteobacteria bacterium]|nr:hypothetical protein [Pseudomonadota bacterium]
MKTGFIIKVLCYAVTPMILGAMLGCAPKLTREVGQLNLQYNSPEQQGAKNDKLIALVSPEVLKSQNNGQAHSQRNANNPFLSAMLQQQMAESGGINTNFYGVYEQNYSPQVRTAIGNGIQEMLTKKGFNLAGPYGTFDDMAYGDKKKSYLALVPVLNLQIIDKVTKNDSTGLTHIHTIEGVISIGGELLVNLIEPMTKERIMSKRINLSDFNISKAYVKQAKVGSSGLMFDAIASGSELSDNSDKALTEAINEFYSLAMAKIDKMISVEEITSYSKQVDELKTMKRF